MKNSQAPNPRKSPQAGLFLPELGRKLAICLGLGLVSAACTVSCSAEITSVRKEFAGATNQAIDHGAKFVNWTKAEQQAIVQTSPDAATATARVAEHRKIRAIVQGQLDQCAALAKEAQSCVESACKAADAKAASTKVIACYATEKSMIACLAAAPAPNTPIVAACLAAVQGGR